MSPDMATAIGFARRQVTEAVSAHRSPYSLGVAAQRARLRGKGEAACRRFILQFPFELRSCPCQRSKLLSRPMASLREVMSKRLILCLK